MENSYEFLKVVGGAVLAVLTYIGGSKIFEILVQRRLQKRDSNEQIHASNQGKQIDDLTAFRKELMELIQKQDAKLERQQEKINGFVETNAQLKADNEILKAANEQLMKQVEVLNTSVNSYREKLDKNTLAFDRLKIHIKNLEGILRMHKIDFPEEV